MGVATKGRRRITVGDRQYLWYVAHNDDGPGMVLHVISPDKRFNVKYEIDQPAGEEYIAIRGRRFVGAETGSCVRRFLCPPFATDAATPRAVRRLIEWCLDEHLTRQETDSRPFRL